MLQKVLRFEYTDGSGIYWRSDGRSLANVAGLSLNRSRHPTPYNDSPIELFLDTTNSLVKFFHFGFKDEDQLRSWFYADKYILELHKHQVVIAEYLCEKEDIVVGNAQVMFRREKSVGKTQYNILDYFKLENK